MEDKDKPCWDCMHCKDGYCEIYEKCPVWIESKDTNNYECLLIKCKESK